MLNITELDHLIMRDGIDTKVLSHNDVLNLRETCSYLRNIIENYKMLYVIAMIPKSVIPEPTFIKNGIKYKEEEIDIFHSAEVVCFMKCSWHPLYNVIIHQNKYNYLDINYILYCTNKQLLNNSRGVSLEVLEYFVEDQIYNIEYVNELHKEDIYRLHNIFMKNNVNGKEIYDYHTFQLLDVFFNELQNTDIIKSFYNRSHHYGETLDHDQISRSTFNFSFFCLHFSNHIFCYFKTL